eukprot:GHVH01016680.1.p1 GENE.GHVH01016680.1~~GHVH01016680.1.p1  ORF type:complete len:296 (-),score=40.14 GHVH01016680.1:40-927(-)
MPFYAEKDMPFYAEKDMPFYAEKNMPFYAEKDMSLPSNRLFPTSFLLGFDEMDSSIVMRALCDDVRRKCKALLIVWRDHYREGPLVDGVESMNKYLEIHNMFASSLCQLIDEPACDSSILICPSESLKVQSQCSSPILQNSTGEVYSRNSRDSSSEDGNSISPEDLSEDLRISDGSLPNGYHSECDYSEIDPPIKMNHTWFGCHESTESSEWSFEDYRAKTSTPALLPVNDDILRTSFCYMTAHRLFRNAIYDVVVSCILELDLADMFSSAECLRDFPELYRMLFTRFICGVDET